MRARTPGVVTDAAKSLWFIVVMALIASGCVAPGDDVVGAETGTGGDARTDASDQTDPTDPLVGSPAAAESVPSVRLVTIGDAATDPVQASPASPADVAVVDLLYDGLTRWDDDAGTWKPDLATSITPDRRARTWTVTLGDRYFSDGQPINAPVVAESIDRLRSASSVVGQRLDHIARIRATDDATVEIELTRADARLPALLSHPLFGITPPTDPGVTLDGTVSSGPFHVTGDDPSALVSLDPLGARPEVDIELLAVGDLETGLALVASGGAEVMHVPPSYDGDIDGAADSGVTLAYGLHAGSPVLRDAEVRGGLIGAIDPEAVAAALPGLAPAVPSDPTLGEDDRSMQLPGAVSLTIVGAETDNPRGDRSETGARGVESALAAAIAAQLSEVGVEVAVRELTLGDFVALVARGDHEIIRTGWVELYPGDRPQWLLVDPASGANVTGLADPSLAAAMRRARRTGDVAAIAAVDRALAEAAVVVPVGRLEVRIVTAPGVDHVAVRRSGSLVLGG